MKDSLPAAVILDIKLSGYGVVRSLYGHGIEIIAFKRIKSLIPESKSNMLNKVISYYDEKHLFDLLSRFKEYKKKPVLFLNSDYYVDFIRINRLHFQTVFNIIFPSNDVIEILLNKFLFSEFAIKNDIIIPKTIKIIKSKFNIDSPKNLNYPVVIKPFYRRSTWNNAGYPKVFYCCNDEEFQHSINKSFLVENELIVQEYIPGNDSDIYFCLVYFSENSNCLDSFTGKKISQWPVDTGSTASATLASEKFVKMETIRIFNKLNFIGFGSIEYKRNPNNGKFYIMEPTVGRLNQQEFVATINGVNLPLIAYNSQTDNNLKFLKNENIPAIYIDERAELRSSLYHIFIKKTRFKTWFLRFKGAKQFRYWNRKDPYVFISLFILILRTQLNKISKLMIKKAKKS